MALNKHLLLYLKGMAMGAADSVPGISGGTVALITNIYEELIHSLKSLNPALLKTLFRDGVGAAWRQANATFLLVLLLGIVTSLLLLANSVLYLLEHHAEQVLSFFAGLIIASVWYLNTKVRHWNRWSPLLGLAGAALAVALAFVPQSTHQPGLVYFFFSGALAICAMILPGISGAFILILLGAYEPVLGALRGFDVAVIAVFVLGCASGLIAFSNLLSWLFRHYHDQTLIFLFGLLIGSLYSIWPWKVAVATRETSEGGTEAVLFRNVWPEDYSRLTGNDADLLACVLLVAFGFLLVYGLEKFAARGR